MAQIIVGIIDILGVLVYLLGPWQTHLLPDQFSPYPYLIGFLYIVIVYINYSISHTSYSLSRNYLIDRDGYDYNSGEVLRLQNILEPSWYVYFMALQSVLNLVAFFWLMISQGIVPAVAIFVISFGVGIRMPINYAFFLQYIRRHLAALRSEQHLAFAVMGVNMVTLTKSVDDYIHNKVNIHNLYIEKMLAATKKTVESERRNFLKHNSVDIAYIESAATAFEVAHDFVGLRALMTEEAGTFQSFIKNLSRTVDYQHFADRAGEIKNKIDKLNSSVKLLSPPKSPDAKEFAEALYQYVNVLSNASELLLKKTKFMAAKAIDAKSPETSYTEFMKIIKDESSFLEECQIIGDKLTILYRKNIGMC